jgi:hypothetical protein
MASGPHGAGASRRPYRHRPGAETLAPSAKRYAAASYVGIGAIDDPVKAGCRCGRTSSQ